MSFLERLAQVGLTLAGFESRFVQTSVGRMHFVDAPGKGELPPMVLLHGFSSCGAHLSPLLRRLRPRVRRLIALDLPSHGRSDAPASALGTEGMKTGLIEALDAAIDEPAVLFGNSMGGFAAITYALARPNKVKALVLCSPGGAAMLPHELDALREGFRLRTYREALDFVDRLVADRIALRPLIAWATRQTMRAPRAQAVLASVSQDDLLSPAQLVKLEMPILLLWGQGDRILPESSFHFFREHLPTHALVERPEKFGHSPYLEHPGRLTRRILMFLGQMARERPAQ